MQQRHQFHRFKRRFKRQFKIIKTTNQNSVS